jgi:hypothetical protein
MARPVPEDAEIMRLVRAGLTYVEIGLRLQISHKTVGRIARSHGYDASKRIKLKAQKRAALRAWQRAQVAFERARADAERTRRLGERDPLRRIPKVPDEYRVAGLAEDYRDLVRNFGAAEGERRCRRLLDEMRQQEAIDARLGRGA